MLFKVWFGLSYGSGGSRERLVSRGAEGLCIVAPSTSRLRNKSR